MGKYLELFRGEVGDLTEKTKLENKPYVAYSTKLGKVTYTEIIKPQPRNEIWYTTDNNQLLEFYMVDKWAWDDNYPSILSQIVEHTYSNGKGIIKLNQDFNFYDIYTGDPQSSYSDYYWRSVFSYTNITSISFPENDDYLNSWFYDTTIPYSSFRGCEKLQTIIIPQYVKRIGAYAFDGCTSLQTIILPSNLEFIGGDVWIGEDVETQRPISRFIGPFMNCSSLTSISIPKTVTDIAPDSFEGCYFTIDKFINNSSLDAEANNYWGATVYDQITESGLIIRDTTVVGTKTNVHESIIIPEGITSINDNLFLNHTANNVEISSTVTNIGVNAFALSNYIMKSDFVNNSSLDVESNNYWGAKVVDEITSDGLYVRGTTIVKADQDKVNSEVIIPEGLTHISDSVFNNYDQINIVRLPSTLQGIENRAFGDIDSVEFYYNGTKQQFKDLRLAKEYGNRWCWESNTDNDYYSIVHCNDGDLSVWGYDV